MPTFTFKARTPAGEVVTGTHEAPSEGEAGRRLRDQGYWVTELRAQAAAPTPNVVPSDPGDKIPLNDFLLGEANPKALALFYRQMASMMNAGMGISQALDLTASGAPPRLRRAVPPLAARTAQGRTLSDAMYPRRELFGRAAWAVIRAGEVAGRLDHALRASAEHFERRWKLQQLVKRAMVYPVILLLANLFIPILPVAVLQGPEAAARILLAQFLSLGRLVLFYLVFRTVIRFEVPGSIWDTVKLHLPVIGKFTRKASAARFIRTLADLYDVGVAPIQALEVAADTCGNRHMAHRLLRARPGVRAGQPLSVALGKTGMLPHVAIQMLATGETSGDVGGLLHKVAEYMEEEMETATQSFMKALPVLLWLAVAIPMIMFIVRGATDYASNLSNFMDSSMNGE
jgi:type IV pilus assembly protein PilC